VSGKKKGRQGCGAGGDEIRRKAILYRRAKSSGGIPKVFS
jgi:hypothetical protein